MKLYPVSATVFFVKPCVVHVDLMNLAFALLIKAADVMGTGDSGLQFRFQFSVGVVCHQQS